MIAASIRQIIFMSSFIASIVWTLPTAVRLNRRSTWFMAGGFGQKRQPHELEGANAIQLIYDSLVSIADVQESVRLSHKCPGIMSCLEAMNKITLTDLGLDEAYVLHAKDSVCMNIVNAPEFDIQIFVIPKGQKLPLHDHPSMAVLSKVISGTLSVQSFSPAKSVSCRELSTGKADLVLQAIRTCADSAWLLTPVDGNVHELEAKETSIVLDVLMPPYSEGDRPCNFYRSVVKDDSWFLESIPPPPNRLLPTSVQYKGQRPTLKEVKWGSMFRRSSPARR